MDSSKILKLALSQKAHDYIDSLFLEIGFKKNEISRLAQAILNQSDYYIQHPESETPWTLASTLIAQSGYYFPLNYLRNKRVFEQLKSRVGSEFLTQFDNYLELGSGLGPSFLALEDVFGELNFKSINFIETSKIPSQLHQKNSKLKNASWFSNTHCLKELNLSKTLLVCSYSLTEFTNIPEWIFECGCVVIIEPSTREDGQRLIKWRKKFIENKMRIIAPCIHESICPMDHEKSKDWCHDRVHIDLPEYLKKVEHQISIKNQTLTLGYLIVTKPQMAKLLKSLDEKSARVVGDYLNEKGKSRQLICRSSEREFLTVLKRTGLSIEFQRGDLIEIQSDWKKVGGELRVAGTE